MMDEDCKTLMPGKKSVTLQPGERSLYTCIRTKADGVCVYVDQATRKPDGRKPTLFDVLDINIKQGVELWTSKETNNIKIVVYVNAGIFMYGQVLAIIDPDGASGIITKQCTGRLTKL